MPLRKLVRPLRIRGHSVDQDVLYANAWMNGALLMVWAVGIGLFIILGGPNGFRNDTYIVLLETFHRCPKLLGVVVTFGGALGAIGAWINCRWLSRTGCVICALWHFAFFGYTLPPNLGVIGQTNLISLAMLMIGLQYAIQLRALRGTPKSDAMAPR